MARNLDYGSHPEIQCMERKSVDGVATKTVSQGFFAKKKEKCNKLWLNIYILTGAKST